MKPYPLLMIASVMFFSSYSSDPKQGNKTATSDLDMKANALIAKMTLEEKVGQMTQVTLDVISKGAMFDANKEQEIDPAKLDTAIHKYKVGSILNTGAYTLPREKWYSIISKIQEEAAKERLKIPVLYGIDAIHGVNYTVGATLFPQELAMAATWNPSLVEKGASITAYEVRASAIPWNFSPVLDLGRQPLWSRFFETYGEDVYLATQMGNAAIKGYQGNDISNPEKVAACLKHFVGYSLPFNGKDRTPIILSERELRELFLPTFASAIKNGAATIMINSSEINGQPVHANYHILTEILKQELKFEGLAVTDWEDIIMLHTVHHVASTPKEAVKLAVNAGVDMSMVPTDYSFAKYLVELVKEGQVPMSRIDDAVRRILKVKYKLGLFNKSYYEMERYSKFGSPEFADVSYKAAQEAVTLLKNYSDILPLKKSAKVLVTGASANSLNALNGAWTHTWQGTDPKYNTKGKKTVLEAIREKIGEGNVKYVEGTDYQNDINISKAVDEAKNVDVIIACIGELPAVEKPGDIEDLELPENQQKLVKELSKTGKPLVLVMALNRPRIISKIEPVSTAIVMAYLPGDEGGKAIADVLFGDINPSGKLPFTYPRSTGSLVTYDHKLSEERDKDFGMNAFRPQFEFGSGLSYTTFEYSDLKVNKNELKGSDSIEVSVTVKNTGNREGKEVVQLYVRDLYASITPSVKKLKGFNKINLTPGESKVVQFKIGKKDLAFVNKDLKWITEPGEFEASVGNQKVSFRYSEK